MSQSHSFNVEFAQLYGIECAILINHFQFWIEQNQRMGRNFHEGRTWMFQTQKEIASHYPYWSEDVVYKLIKKLVDEGVLIKGNFNKKKFDQTKWYAFKFQEKFTKPSNDGNESIERRKPSRQTTEPIPDTNTDTKQLSCIVDVPVSNKNLYILKIEKLNSKKEKVTYVLEDIFLRALREKKDWTTSEIEEAWKVLINYPNPINCGFGIIEGIINNLRKNKNKTETKIDKKQTKEVSSYDKIPKNTSEGVLMADFIEKYKQKVNKDEKSLGNSTL